MTLLRDIEPLLHGARIFGCTPHRITDKDMLLTKLGLVYSLILGFVFLYGCVAGVYYIAVDVIEMKLLLLTAMRTILSFICFYTDDILTMIWNEKLRTALAHMHGFDVTTHFSQKINRAHLNRCRLVLAVTILFWCIVGYVSYRCEDSSPIFTGISYGIVNGAMSMQILKFIGFLTLLNQRFIHLQKLITPDENAKAARAALFNVSGTIIPVLNQSYQTIRLHDVWWLHFRLTSSAEGINFVYSTQLLFWITTLFLNALSRIYTLTEGDGRFTFLNIRESLSVTASLMNLIIITGMCHFTATQANKIGKTIFSPCSVLLRKRCYIEDNIEVGMYFHLRRFHFSAGAGIIRIDLPLLLSIGGAMTTYLVILHALNNS